MRTPTLVALALVAVTSCYGTDPYNPGTGIGTFHVTAALVETTCGSTPNPWTFDVKLRHDATTLYWIQGDEPVHAVVDAASHATLTATTSASYGAATQNSPGCSVERDDTMNLSLLQANAAATDIASADAFRGTIAYRFSATSGSDCTAALTASGGDFDALPCDVSYTIAATRTGAASP